MSCPTCGMGLPEGATYCHRCRSYLSDMEGGEALGGHRETRGGDVAPGSGARTDAPLPDEGDHEVSPGSEPRDMPHGERRTLPVARAGEASVDAPLPDDRPEKEIRTAIVKLLRTLGYGVWDTEQGYRKDGSTRVTKGLPDLFVAGPAGTAAVEVKSAKGEQTPEQREFEALWTGYGGTYMVWRTEREAVAWHERRALSDASTLIRDLDHVHGKMDKVTDAMVERGLKALREGVVIDIRDGITGWRG